MLLLPRGLVLAQSEAAPATGKPDGQTATDRQTGAGGDDVKDILSLDIDQLVKTPVVVPSMDIAVTSVTKEPSTVGRSAAAVFVITPEMIRRSGATCIPEALRMAPGVEVARINANAWAISIRGFNGPYANKLLVLIDGRSVYNPDFGGVYWDMQDVLMEDIERIEVIRGPGGTLWGANAVNGVINVITKKAKDTQGTYLMAGGGSQDKATGAVRYGGQIGDDFHYRIYAKYFDIGPGVNPSPAGMNDAWQQGHFGFRSEWELDSKNSVTIQGDHFLGNTANSGIPIDFALPQTQTGDNLLMRWHRLVSEDSDWTLQTYYDMFSLGTGDVQNETVKTFDVDFQYHFHCGDRQNITCGANFRDVESRFVGSNMFTSWYPIPDLTTNYTGQFIQDEIAVVEDLLTLTLGTKLEQDPYTGLEYQPTVRLLWAPDHQQSIWGAISRAVCTPARVDEQGSITFPVAPPDVYERLIGNNGLVSEDMMAYELGYRVQATEQFSWDIALFYNEYQHLIGFVPQGLYPEPLPLPPHWILPLLYANGSSADTYGVELSANYAVSKRWRLYAQYTCLEMQGVEQETDPQNQIYLRSSWDLRENLELDLMARYVDSMPLAGVPSYTTMDLRLAWRPRERLELAVVGQNLLQDAHYEYPSNPAVNPSTATTEVPRSVYGSVTWRF